MSQRKEYRRTWMARKRFFARSKTAAGRVVTLSSDSDSDDAVDVQESIQTTETTNMDFPTLESVSKISDASDASGSHSDGPMRAGAWDLLDTECLRESDSDSNTGTDGDDSNLAAELKTWFVDNDVTHSQLDKLLAILKKYHSDLPVTSKTLLKTPEQQNVDLAAVSGGDYVYFGLQKGLCEVLNDNEDVLSTLTEIELAFNIDGLPLFSSSSYSLWPVLCYAMNVSPHKVFIVALYGGKSKPCDLAFIEQTVNELKYLMLNGIDIGGRRVKCIAKMCVCDAVARAMVKCVKQFSGYYGCDKCSQRGKYVGRMTYPECDAPLRSDGCFRSCTNSEHHTGTSPFCSLPIDMIVFFPIDYMHQVCLGVMKRLLLCWTLGGKKTKLSSSQKSQINARIAQFRHCVSKEFSRKPRSLDELRHWKATEFRTFLLYEGYFVLHGIISDEVLVHFMCLSVGLAILVSERLSSNAEYRRFAHDLLIYFVQKSAQLYGPEFMVYNVHSLTHISMEAEHFGKLDNCSAFIFESYMQQVKKCVRSGRSPLMQVAHRMHQKNFFSRPLSPAVVVKDSLANFSCQPPDNSCILESGECCHVTRIEDGNVLCMTFANSYPVYSSPCDSCIIGAHKVRLSAGALKLLPPGTKAYKALSFTDASKSEVVFLQLLHYI